MNGDELLHAYLDRELKPDQEPEFIAWLKSDPENVRKLVRTAHFDDQIRRAWTGLKGLEAALAKSAAESCPSCFPDANTTTHRWNKWHLAIAATIAVVLGVAAWHFNAGVQPKRLQITAMSGHVSVRRGADEISASRLDLQEGDRVRTGAASSAILSFQGEPTEISLAENTEIVFSKHTPAKEFLLHSGRLSAMVAPQSRGRPLLINSPHGIAQVLGTRFNLAAGPQSTVLDVTEGRVHMTAADQTTSGDVDAGQRAVARPGDAVVPHGLEAGIPKPWQSSDIGKVALTGSATYEDGRFTIRASGDDIWNEADGFRFVYQPMQGDVTITARVARMDDTESRAKAGVMIREGFAAGARHATMSVSARWDLWFHWRADTDGPSRARQRTGAQVPFVRAPYWIRLERRGTTFSAYCSENGSDWNLVGTHELSLPSLTYVGLVVSSHDNSKLNTSVFESVEIAPLPNPPSS